MTTDLTLRRIIPQAPRPPAWSGEPTPARQGDPAMTLSRRSFAAGVVTAALALNATTARAAEPRTGTVTVGGVDYWYEIAGQGEPLLMLHGGLGSFHMFDPILPAFLHNRTVIGVDLYGHGHTAITDRPWDVPAVGADMAELLQALGYDQVDVFGYSLGAGVGFQLAVQHPGMVRRLVLLSGGFSSGGFYPEMRAMQAQVGAGMAEMMKGTPMHDGYLATAPRPDDFPRLLDAMGAYMRTDYDWRDQVAGLTMPVMLIYGDADMWRPEHAVEFFHLLGGGLKDGGWMREGVTRNRLAILPGRTHYELGVTPETVAAALPFLDGTETAPVWTEAGK